jgi:hypothetical protein
MNMARGVLAVKGGSISNATAVRAQVPHRNYEIMHAFTSLLRTQHTPMEHTWRARQEIGYMSLFSMSFSRVQFGKGAIGFIGGGTLLLNSNTISGTDSTTVRTVQRRVGLSRSSSAAEVLLGARC